MARRKTSGLEPTSTDVDNSNTCGRKLEARPALGVQVVGVFLNPFPAHFKVHAVNKCWVCFLC